MTESVLYEARSEEAVLRSGEARARRSPRRWILLAIAVVITVIGLFPIYWMIVTSILPSSVVLSEKPPLLPPLGDIEFSAYTRTLADSNIGRWLLNSTIMTFGTVILSMIVSVLAGYSLSRFRIRIRWGVGFALLVTRMLPGTLLVIPMFMMFSAARMTDSLWILILANTSAVIPFSAWMMKSFFDSVPMELEEAAMVDGCSRGTALRFIVLPLTLPGLAATSIFAAIVAWSDFLFARTLIFSPDKWTMTLGTVSFIGAYEVNWSGLMAAGVVSMVPMLLVFFLLEPFLVRGLAAGAVKG